jgi:hypothetical protein
MINEQLIGKDVEGDGCGTVYCTITAFSWRD